MKNAKKRIRRTVEASKLVILEAAERHLIAEGPSGVKIKPIAHELGLTDAAVHYHFGSREALMSALLRYAGRKLVAELTTAISASQAGELNLRQIARLMLLFYRDRGAGRLAMWLSLEGWKPEGAGMLTPLVDWLHRSRVAEARSRNVAVPMRMDSQRIIALLSTVTLSEALFGDAALRSVGLQAVPKDALVSWLVRLLEAYRRG